MFKPNEHTEVYDIRKPNDKNFPFEIEDKRYLYEGAKLVSFEKSDKIVEHFSKEKFNVINYPYAYSKENIYFLIHQKYITKEENKNSKQKGQYAYLYKIDN